MATAPEAALATRHYALGARTGLGRAVRTAWSLVLIWQVGGLLIGQMVQSARAQRYALLGLTLLSAVALSGLSALASGTAA